MKIKVKRLSESAIIPTKNQGDAGYDLYSTEDCSLHAFERHLFKTDIAMAIPEGYYGKICDRSGKAWKDGLHVMAGTIDSTYRGNIGVVLINLKHEWQAQAATNFNLLRPVPVEIKKGDKIAQIVIRAHESPELIDSEELDETDRGAGGFGSTGR